MEYVTLPYSRLKVSRICMGCEALGGTDHGSVDPADLASAVSECLDNGINFFDTANIYGLGRSEIALSEALGERRHDVVIASKFGVNWTPAEGQSRATTFLDSSPAHLRQALEDSLKRLRIDCIPLYYIHWPDSITSIEDTMDALVKCLDEGKIRAIGVSNFSADLIRRAHACHPLSAVQLEYSLINFSDQIEVLDCCRELEIPAVSWGSLAQGLLTGKYSADNKFPANDRRSRLPHFESAELEKHLATVERLKEVADRHGRTIAQTAVRWILDEPGVECAIIGAKSGAQTRANVGAADWRLDTDERLYLAAGESLSVETA